MLLLFTQQQIAAIASKFSDRRYEHPSQSSKETEKQKKREDVLETATRKNAAKSKQMYDDSITSISSRTATEMEASTTVLPAVLIERVSIATMMAARVLSSK